MSLPESKSPDSVSMRELYQSHPHLQGTGKERPTLVWEKLWRTSSEDYGRYARISSRPLTNAQRNSVWNANHYDTTNAEYGKAVHALAKSTQNNSQTSQSTVGTSCKNACDLTTCEKSVKASDNNSNISPQSGQSRRLQPLHTECTSKQNVNADLRNQEPLPPIRDGDAVPGDAVSKPTHQKQLNDQHKDVTVRNLTVRPFPISGAAKDYMETTNGSFWDNLNTL